MKPFSCALLFISLTFSPLITKAQYRNVVKFNPLSVVVTSASIFYERALTRHVSLQLGLLYDLPSNIPFTDITQRGFGLTPEIRFYPFSKRPSESDTPLYKRRYSIEDDEKKAPRGFYVGPFVRYRHNILELYPNKTNVTAGTIKSKIIGAGIVFGYQAIFLTKWENISVDFFAGPHINRRDYSATEGLNKEEYTLAETPFGFRLGTTLGIAF